MPNFCKEKTIKEVLEFLDSFFIYNKIAIVMMDDDGNDHIVLKPTKYEDIKYSDIKHILDEKVYSFMIAKYDDEGKALFEIAYCDPEGEWK